MLDDQAEDVETRKMPPMLRTPVLHLVDAVMTLLLLSLPVAMSAVFLYGLFALLFLRDGAACANFAR